MLPILGNKEVLTEQVSRINRPFEQVTFSKDSLIDLNNKIGNAEQISGGHRLLRFPNSFISTTPSVKDYSVNTQNARFYTFVSVELKSGKKVGLWITPGQEYEGEKIRQGSVSFVLHRDKEGKPIVAFVSQRRFAGNVEKVELPRGFEKRKVLEKGANFAELSEETGIPISELERYQTHSLVVPEDPIRANVEFEFLMIELPPEKRFNLDKLAEEAEARNRPGALLEELTPSWIGLKDIVEGTVEGTFVTDAHTTAGLFTAVLLREAVIFAPEIEQMGIVLEKFQDWRTAGSKLGIPRGNSQRMHDVLRGELNPNTGPCRIWNKIGFATHTAGLPKGSYEVIGINQLLDDIKRGKVDIVTSSAVFKTLMQKGFIAIDYSKI